jgi:GH18 family chitinase/chitodextrinase
MKTWRRQIGVTLTTLAALSTACSYSAVDQGNEVAEEGTTAVAQQALSASDKAVVGYWPNWDGSVPPSAVPWTKVTHINVAFVGINTNHQCAFWTDWNQQDVADPVAAANTAALIAERNRVGASTKIMLSVGGWSLSYRFSEALTSSKRAAFLSSCVTLMNDLGADGLDFDWEYPGRLGPTSGFGSCKSGATCSRPGTAAGSDYANFGDFLTELRAATGMSGKLMTAAVRANGYSDGTKANDSQYIEYPYSVMEAKLDHTLVMAYDLHGSFEPKTNHNAKYSEVQNTMNYWMSKYSNDSKLGLGLPFYGYIWHTSSSSNVGADATGVGQIAYNTILANYTGGTCTNYTDTNDRWKHCTGTVAGYNTPWITYDTADSLDAKINWWNSYSYRTMYWVMGQDSGSVLTDKVWTKTGNTGSADTQLPTAPATLTTSGITSSAITLNWAASTDNVGVTGYRVFKNGVQLTTTTSTNYQFTGLLASTSYTLGVAAYDAAGNVSLTSSNAETTSASGGSGGTTCPTFVQPYSPSPGYMIGDKVTFGGSGYQSKINNNTWSPTDYAAGWETTNCAASDTQAPTTPGGRSTSSITASAITLSWSASTDNVAVTGYKVFKDGVQVTTTTSTSYTFTGLTANTSYTLGVSAYDAAGNVSTLGTTAGSTTIASTDTQAPTTPGSLSTSGITTSAITLNWSASSDNTAVTGYRVFRNGTFVTNVTGTSYQFTGLSSGTSYTLSVLAYDAALNESASGSSTVSTSSGGSSCAAWVQPYAPNPGYMVNDKVTFNGSNYKSLYNNNAHSPANWPGGWTTTTCP